MIHQPSITKPALYHFTSTARLPWILSSSELQPGANAVGKFPNPEFIWATTDYRGSRTAAIGPGYRDGTWLLVRLTLSADDFEPWARIPSLYPTWTPEAVERLERSGRKMGDDPAQWWCRAGSLPLSRIVAIETKAYRASNWAALCSREIIGSPDGALGIVIGGTMFFSTQFKESDGRTGYLVGSYPASGAER
jgi:hypothetical protein